MDAGIIVGIAGIVVGAAVSIATYYLGRRRGQRIREEDKSDQRIERFVGDYIERYRRIGNDGVAGLVPTGVCNLRDDSEIRAALDTCRKRLRKHPLGQDEEKLASVDLKRFFEFAVDKKVSFVMTPVEEVVRRMSEDHE